MAYFAMMAVFPFFLLLTTVVAFLPIPDLFDRRSLQLLADFAPEEVVRLLRGTIREVTQEKKVNLLSASLIVCIWMASGAMSSTTRGLNKAFGLKDPRRYFRFFGLSLLMTLMLGMLLIVGIVVILLGPRLEEFVLYYLEQQRNIDIGNFGRFVFRILRNLLPILFLFIVHSGIYWLCPAMKKKFRIFSAGTLFSVTSWVGVSIGFKLYLDQFNNYDRFYGSLGAVILSLVWFYLMSFMLLIGGQIDAVLHPEYKANVNEETPANNEPLPWKLVGITVLILVLVPLGIRNVIDIGDFTPMAKKVGGELSEQVRMSIENGTKRRSNLELTRILERHVDEKGTIDYAALAKDAESLEAWLEGLAEVEVASLDKDHLRALLINAYNAAAILMAARQESSIETPMDVKDFRSRKVVRLAGKDLSLDDIRDGILRSDFPDDPRQLCALHDATLGSPKLRPRAYEGILLDQQLDTAVREYLRPPWTRTEDGKLWLPIVIAKYRGEFEAAAEDGALTTYVSRYLSDEARVLLEEKGEKVIEFRTQADNALNRRK